jgi:hypothetical protein
MRQSSVWPAGPGSQRDTGRRCRPRPRGPPARASGDLTKCHFTISHARSHGRPISPYSHARGEGTPKSSRSDRACGEACIFALR